MALVGNLSMILLDKCGAKESSNKQKNNHHQKNGEVYTLKRRLTSLSGETNYTRRATQEQQARE